MFEGYNGGPLMNPLARIQEAEQTEPDYCHTCGGKGGAIERQDPVGDGVGFETFLNACPDCLGCGKCPWCSGPVDAEYNCANESCAWTPDQIDAPGSFDDDYYDYPDDDPGFDPMFLM